MRTTLCGTVEYLPPELCKIHLEKLDSGSFEAGQAVTLSQVDTNSNSSTSTAAISNGYPESTQFINSQMDDASNAGNEVYANGVALVNENGGVETIPCPSDDGRYDHRFDIYTAGALLYEMLIGHSPFAGPEYANKYVFCLYVMSCSFLTIRCNRVILRGSSRLQPRGDDKSSYYGADQARAVPYTFFKKTFHGSLDAHSTHADDES